MTVIRSSDVLAWTERIISQAPQAPGVYVLYDRARKILYIGMSGNLRERLFQHYRESDIPGVAFFQWFETDSEENARSVESDWVRKYRPPYNQQT